jgi:hypothetical protein
MKRFVVFMLIGPAVGYVVFQLLQLLSGKGGGWEALILGLPFAYLFAILPSLVMWSWDSLLFNRTRIWLRIATSAIAGYAASIAMLMIWAAVQVPLRQALTFGIAGAVQAAVCSWLARSSDAPEAPRRE